MITTRDIAENLKSFFEGIIQDKVNDIPHLASVYAKLFPEQKETFIICLRALLTEEHANKAYLDYMYSQDTCLLEMLCSRGISIDTYARAIDTSNNIQNCQSHLSLFLLQQKKSALEEKGEKKQNENLKKVMGTVIERCKREKDWQLIDILASNVIEGNEITYGRALLQVAWNAPHRIDIIKKLVDAKASLTVQFNNDHFTVFDCIVHYNNYAALAVILKDASMQDVAQCVAHVLAKPIKPLVKNHNNFIKAIKQIIKTPENTQSFYTELNSLLSSENANAAFLAHIDDDQPSDILELLKHCKIDVNTQIKAIETCKNITTAALYLNEFLEQKPQSDNLERVIQNVIIRCQNANNWDLANMLACKIIPGHENAYGELLLYVAKADQKEIAKKLLKANASLKNSNEAKIFALHFMAKHKWNDVIAEMVETPEGSVLLANGVAEAFKQPNECSMIASFIEESLKNKSKQREDFYIQLHTCLKQNEAEEYFIKHVNDKYWAALQMLMHYGLPTDALITNLEKCSELDKKTYLTKLLEKKLATNEFEKIMDVVVSSKNPSSLIEMILNNNAQIEGREEIYGKALLSVVKLGDYDLAAKLIEAGAKIDLKNSEEKTAEMVAISQGKHYEAALLRPSLNKAERESLKKLRAKYSIEQLNNLYYYFYYDDQTLQNILAEDALFQEEKSDSTRYRLKLASVVFKEVCNQEIEVLELLFQSEKLLKITKIEAQKMLTYRDEEGNTALHKAVEIGNLKIIKLLMNAGANPNQGNNYGRSPLFLANLKSNLTMVKILQTPDPAIRDQIPDESTTYEVELQRRENPVKRMVYTGIQGDIANLNKWEKICLKAGNYGRYLFALEITRRLAKTHTDKKTAQAKLERLNFAEFTFLRHRVTESDKSKLQALQKFFIDNDTFLEKAKNEYPELDIFTRILLVMKKQLINKIDKNNKWEVEAKNKIKSSIRSILKEEFYMTDQQAEVEMNLKLATVKSILDPSTMRMGEDEQKEIPKQKNQYLAAIMDGEINAIIHAADSHLKELSNLSPNYVRIMSSCTDGAVFGDESDRATYEFFLNEMNPGKSFSIAESETLQLMKTFFIYVCNISPQLKKYVPNNDSIGLKLLALEHASQYDHFTPIQIETINDRYKKSLASLLIKEGGLSAQASRKIIDDKVKENEKRVIELDKLPCLTTPQVAENPPAYEDDYDVVKCPLPPQAIPVVTIESTVPPLATTMPLPSAPVLASEPTQVSSTFGTLFNSYSSAADKAKSIEDQAVVQDIVPTLNQNENKQVNNTAKPKQSIIMA